MSSLQTIETPQDYVNYTFNITSRGITEVAGEMAGLSNTVTTVLGQLAFKTSEFLTHTEALAVGMGVASVAAFASATQEAVKFEQAIANVQAIGGESINAMEIGQAAMKYSSQFGMDVNSMTEGLEALSRAGLTATNVMSGVLAEGVKLSKLEGMDLEDSINNLISTTNLLATKDYDINSPEYAEAVKQMNQHIVSTSESAPINAENIIQTLQHVGGYASANSIDQDDLFAVIAQLGAKGTKGEMAGTALRAFIAAGQKDQAQRALARIGLNVSDLWDESGNAMLPVSEMKDVIDNALDAQGYSKQEKLEFYSDFAGYKQANQIMKIDTSEVKEYKENIAQAWDLGKKLETILGTTHNNVQTLFQTIKNFMTRVGSSILPVINAIVIPIKWGVQLLDAMPFSENITGMLLAMAGIKTVLIFINRIIPTLASMYTSFSRSNKEAEGIRGHFHNMLVDLREAKSIITNLNNPKFLSQTRLKHGLMGEQSYQQHKTITEKIYNEYKAQSNSDLPEWNELGKTKQDIFTSVVEAFKDSDIYREIQDTLNEENAADVKKISDFLNGKSFNDDNIRPSNIDKNNMNNISKNTQVNQDLSVIKNHMNEAKDIIKRNTENITQEDIGVGIMSVADKLAEAFVNAFNRDKNQTTINIDGVQVRTDKSNAKQVSNELSQIFNQSRKKDLPDIGFHYNHDLKKMNAARNALIKDINRIASDFSNTDLQYINSTQRTRIGKQLDINQMSPRGKRESILRNEAEIRDIFNKFEKYEQDIKHGLIPSISSNTKNLAFTTDTSTFWVDPKDANKGIRIEQIEAFEDILNIENRTGDRAQRIQKILQEYEKLSSNERYIALEKGIYKSKNIYSNFLKNREYPSDISTRHIDNNIAKELLDIYGKGAPSLTGTYAEQLQQLYKTLNKQQKTDIETILYMHQKRNAQGIYTESEATQLSMMFDKLVMLNNAIANTQSRLENIDTNTLDALSDLFDVNNIPQDILSNINNGGYFVVNTPTNEFNNYSDSRTDYGDQSSNDYFYDDFESQIEEQIRRHSDALNYDEKAATAQVHKAHKTKSSILGEKIDLSKILEPLNNIKDNVQKLVERLVPSSSSLVSVTGETFNNMSDETGQMLANALNNHAYEMKKTREFYEHALHKDETLNQTYLPAAEQKSTTNTTNTTDDDYIDVKIVESKDIYDNIAKNNTIFDDTDSIYGIIYNQINETFLTKLVQSITQFENSLQTSIPLLEQGTQLFLTNNQYINDVINGFVAMGHLLRNNVKMLPENIYPNFILKDSYGPEQQGNLLQLLDKYSPYSNFLEMQENLLQISDNLTEEEVNYLSTIISQIRGRFYRFSVRSQQYNEPIGPIPQQPITKTTYAFGATGLGAYEKQYRFLANGAAYAAPIGPQNIYGVTPQLVSQKVAQYQTPIELSPPITDADKYKQYLAIEEENRQNRKKQEHQAYIDFQAKETEKLIGITERYNAKMAKQAERNNMLAKQANQRYQNYKKEREELLKLAFTYDAFIDKPKPVQIQSPKGVLQEPPRSAPTGEFTILKQAQFFPGLDNNYYQYLNNIQKQKEIEERNRIREATLRYEAIIQAEKYSSIYAQLYPKYINPEYIEQSQAINERFNPISAFVTRRQQYDTPIGPLPALDYTPTLYIDSHLNGQREKAEQSLQRLKDRRYQQQIENYGYGPGRGSYYASNVSVYERPRTFIQEASEMNFNRRFDNLIDETEQNLAQLRAVNDYLIIDLVNKNFINNEKPLDFSGTYRRGSTIIGNGDLALNRIEHATNMLNMFEDNIQKQQELKAAQTRYRNNQASNSDLILLGITTASKIEEERGAKKAEALAREQENVKNIYARINKQQEELREYNQAVQALSVLFEDTPEVKAMRQAKINAEREYQAVRMAANMFNNLDDAFEERMKQRKRAKEKFKKDIDNTNKIWEDSKSKLFVASGFLDGVAENVDKFVRLFPPLGVISTPINVASEKLEALAEVFDLFEEAVGTLQLLDSDLTQAEAESIGLGQEYKNAQLIKRYVTGENAIFNSLLAGMGVNVTEAVNLGKTFISAIMKEIGVFIAANASIILPPLAAIAAVIGLLAFSEQRYTKALEEATQAREEAHKEASANYITYKNLHEARQAETDAMKRQQLARKESIALYELEASRVKQINAINKESDLRNDKLWGEYGARANLQKMSWLEAFIAAGGPIGLIAKSQAGEFESQYEKYEGSTGEIRRVKEDAVGNIFASSNQRAVSAWYDAHYQQLGQIEAFAPDLQKLYDLESQLIEEYGSLEAARNSEEFRRAVQEFSDATGINRETAEKYLDYLQTEANVENARYAMQAEVNIITSKAQAEAYKALYGDESGMGDLTGIQDAMVYATADDIFKDAYHELWWSMLMEWLQAIYNVLTFHWGDASKHAKAAEAYQQGMRELAENQGRITEEGVEIAREDQRKSYGTEEYSLYNDTLFGGAYESLDAMNQDWAAEGVGTQSTQYSSTYTNNTEATQHKANQYRPTNPNVYEPTITDGVEGTVIPDRSNRLEPIQKDILHVNRQILNHTEDINKAQNINQWYASGHNNGDNSFSARAKNAFWYDKGFGLPPGVDPNDPAVQEELRRRQTETGVRLGGHGIGAWLANFLSSKSTPAGAKGAVKWGMKGVAKLLNPEEVQLFNTDLLQYIPDSLIERLPNSIKRMMPKSTSDIIETSGSVVGEAAELGIKHTDDILKLGTKGLENAGKTGARRIIPVAGEEVGEEAIKVTTKKTAENAGKAAGKTALKSGEKGLAETGAKSVGKAGAKAGEKAGAEAGVKGLAKAGSKTLAKAAPLVGPFVTAAFSIAEHNPFETHYNEDGSEKRALQSTGEVAGEVAGSVVAMGLGAIASFFLTPLGGALVEMGASLILEPAGKAIGGLLGWVGDELFNGAMGFLFGSDEEQTNPSDISNQIDSSTFDSFQNSFNTGGTFDSMNAALPDNTNNVTADNSKTEVHIHQVNINTADDPEAIKDELYNLIIELGENVSPRQVSRIIGQPPSTSSTFDMNTDDPNAETNTGTEDTANADPNNPNNTNPTT